MLCTISVAEARSGKRSNNLEMGRQIQMVKIKSGVGDNWRRIPNIPHFFTPSVSTEVFLVVAQAQKRSLQRREDIR